VERNRRLDCETQESSTLSAGEFDYSVAGSAAWFDVDVFNSNVPGQAAGWYDFDYLQPPTSEGPLFLYYLQGGGDPWKFDPVTENFYDPQGLYSLVPWQTVDELSESDFPIGPVSWDDFQKRTFLMKRRDEGKSSFQRLAQELKYKQDFGPIVRKTIKVAGVTYILWRLLF
jgi:hypothetical protein